MRIVDRKTDNILLRHGNLGSLGAVDTLLAPLLARPARGSLAIAAVLFGAAEIAGIAYAAPFRRRLLLLLLLLLLLFLLLYLRLLVVRRT
jgi:hypothetical protein